MKVSIVIPCYNPEKTIALTLSSILKSDFPKSQFEVIVVDDGSIDSTRDIVKKFKGVILVQQKHKGPAAARNLGARKAKAGIIAFLDSDCAPEKKWLKIMVKEMMNRETTAVYGSLIDGEKNIYSKAIHLDWAHSLNPKMKKEERVLATSANFCIRKKIFNELNGFDEEVLWTEDTALSIKLKNKNYRIVFLPEAKAKHFHKIKNLKNFLFHRFEHGIGEAYVNLKYDNPFSWSFLFRKNFYEMLLFLPVLFVVSFSFVLWKNLKYSPEVILYAPLLFLGRIYWSAGVMKGVKKFSEAGDK
ncbi:MAG: glycosyltransferase [Candidatus Diapherotrites archaeon]